jgi:hypothetical protein
MQVPTADAQLPFHLTLQFQISMTQAAMTWTTEAVTQLKRWKNITK